MQLAAHYAQITKDERPSLPSGVHLPLLIHITYPMEFLQAGQYKPVPQGITTVVAVLQDKDHYGVLEIDITKKTVLIYDGLYRDLTDGWTMCLARLSAACCVTYKYLICMLQMIPN